MILKDPQVTKRIGEAEGVAVRGIVHVLHDLFGDIALRQIDEEDLDRFRAVLSQHADDVIRPVEGHYINEGYQTAQKNTASLLEAALAGTIVGSRREEAS